MVYDWKKWRPILLLNDNSSCKVQYDQALNHIIEIHNHKKDRTLRKAMGNGDMVTSTA